MFSISRFLKQNAGGKNCRNLEMELVDAICSFENRDFPEAAERFGNILGADPEHPIAHLMLGRSLIEMSEYEYAIEAFERHLEIMPDSVEALIYLGLACYELGRHEDAVEFFERAHELKRDSIMARENLAIAHLAAGDLSDAIAELINLHIENPKDRNLIELIVLALGKKGKWETAKQYSELLK